MSSSSRQLVSIPPDDAASREDLELFQRLLRVARLFKNHEVDDLWNPTPSRNHTSHNGTCDGHPGSVENGNASGRIEQAAGTDMNYDDYDDDHDDYDNDEDDDDNEEGEAVREGSSNAAALLNQPVIPNKTQSPKPSRPKQSGREQDSGGAAPTRRRPRQRPDQQQHQRPHAAVEKRYRSVVNSKIQQLRASIPPSITFSPIHANTPPESRAAEAVQEMPTKSIVLDRATQYINHLVATYEQYETERTELRRKLQFWLDNISPAEIMHPGKGDQD